MYLNEHFKEIEKNLNFPSDAVKIFEATATQLDSNETFAEKFDEIYKRYMFPEAHNFGGCMEELAKLSSIYNIHEHTLQLVFLIIAAEDLHKLYKINGLSEKLFWDTVQDLYWKYKECVDCKEVHGIFVGDWATGFYNLTRFTLGRYQYDTITEFDEDEYTTSSGITLKKGDKVLGFHIPSSGIPLTDDVRIDSLKKAYNYFKDFRRKDGMMIFACHSWLIYEGYCEFLPPNSNILKFINDFEIVESHSKDNFDDAWRIFAKYSSLPPEEWPEDTSLRKAFKENILNGKKTGSGYGIIVFDGEKIIH